MKSKIQKIIHSPYGRIISSMLLGFGLATLFRKACHDRNCIQFYAPSVDRIENQVYSFDGECYRFKPKMKKCSKDGSLKTVLFE